MHNTITGREYYQLFFVPSSTRSLYSAGCMPYMCSISSMMLSYMIFWKAMFRSLSTEAGMISSASFIARSFAFCMLLYIELRFLPGSGNSMRCPGTRSASVNLYT